MWAYCPPCKGSPLTTLGRPAEMALGLNLIDQNVRRNRMDLARQIQATIRNFTFGRPMPVEEIVATIAFCAGSIVGNQRGDTRRDLVGLAGHMLAHGEHAAAREDDDKSVIDIDALLN